MKDISVYSATKQSITSITDNLRELMGMKDLPVRVTVIYLLLGLGLSIGCINRYIYPYHVKKWF